MTEYTPEKLREWAKGATLNGSRIGDCPCHYAGTVALFRQLRAHAAALETIRERDAEIAMLRGHCDAMARELTRLMSFYTGREYDDANAVVKAYRRDEEARDE